MNVTEVKEFATELWYDEEECELIEYEGKQILAHIIANSPFSAGGYSTKMYIAVRKRDFDSEPKAKDLVVIGGQDWRVHFDKLQGNIIGHDDIEYIIPLKSDVRVSKFR